MSKKGPTMAEKIFKDPKGNIVIAQFPNAPLIGWLLCVILARADFFGELSEGINFLGNAFLFTWAYLELTAGVNYFRKILGGVILVFVSAALLGVV